MKGLLALLLLAGGCALQPVYSGGPSGTSALLLADVAVAPIPERGGWLVRDRLVQRMGSGVPRYRLDVALDDGITGFGVRGDNSIIRERRTLRARFQLVDLASGATLLDSTAAADAGIDVVTSEFAVLAAEQTALERLAEIIADDIVDRLTRHALNPAPPAPSPAPSPAAPPAPFPAAPPRAP